MKSQTEGKDYAKLGPNLADILQTAFKGGLLVRQLD